MTEPELISRLQRHGEVLLQGRERDDFFDTLYHDFRRVYLSAPQWIADPYWKPGADLDNVRSVFIKLLPMRKIGELQIDVTFLERTPTRLVM